jgi:hypothetical protein
MGVITAGVPSLLPNDSSQVIIYCLALVIKCGLIIIV